MGGKHADLEGGVGLPDGPRALPPPTILRLRAQSVGLWLPVVSPNKQDFEHLSFQVSLGGAVWAGKGLGKQGSRRDNTSSVQHPPPPSQ